MAAAIFPMSTYQTGLGDPTIPFLAWGTAFLDFDNDGLLDIFIANGHVYPGVDAQDWGTTWAERPQLFRNSDGSKFKEVPPATGSGLADVIPGARSCLRRPFQHWPDRCCHHNIDSTPALLRNVVNNGQIIGWP